jgi:hypothetical protein
MTNPWLSFKMVNRDAEIKELTNAFERNYKIQLMNEKEKFTLISETRDLSLIVANQMSGSGKTRFGEDYLEKVRDTDPKTEFEKEIAMSIAVYVQLKNRIDLAQMTENTLGKELINIIIQSHPDPKLSRESFELFLNQNDPILDGYEKKSLLFKLGMYLTKSNGKSRHVYIMIDQVDELFTHSFKEFKGKLIHQIALVLWNYLLCLMQIPGIHIFLTCRSMVFHYLGSGFIRTGLSPSPIKFILLNPIKR